MPPEINSARMYVGPRLRYRCWPRPQAWDRIGHRTGRSGGRLPSVTTRLNGGWQGYSGSRDDPGRGSVPRVAERRGVAKASRPPRHAKAAANAYEEAHAAMVPPPVIAANRSHSGRRWPEMNQLSQDSPGDRGDGRLLRPDVGAGRRGHVHLRRCFGAPPRGLHPFTSRPSLPSTWPPWPRTVRWATRK